MSDYSNITAATAPLAVRMRPQSLDELVGQAAALRAGSALRTLASAGTSTASSVILYGPPGTGKTTIAQILAREPGRAYSELSAISAGVKEVRDVIEAARTALYDFNRKTVLFLDEIHRFSKAQQDALLPAVENGWLILVAATTENPSFSVIPPLLSRSLIVELAELAPADIQEIIQRAVVSPRGLAGLVELQPPAAEQIVRLAQGDARRALTLLEAAALSAIGQAETAAAKEASTEVEASGSAKPVVIDLERVEAVAAAAAVRYDRAGDSHYDIISAFIKSVRGSDADAAIHYLARMLVAGEDPRFIARRLMILAAEDIGLADPQALVLATATANCVALIGMPEGRIPLAETTIYLALAPKSNSAYTAINSAMADVQGGLTPPVPGPLRGASYSGAARLGRGKGYVYPHDDPAAVVPQQYVGAGAAAKAYYKPRVFGFEQSLVQRWERLRQIIRAKK